MDKGLLYFAVHRAKKAVYVRNSAKYHTLFTCDLRGETDSPTIGHIGNQQKKFAFVAKTRIFAIRDITDG